MSQPSTFDVVVIGAGPGGYVAAIRAAQLGKRVLVVEKEEVGGVCLNRGCIPSKSLISASHRFQEMIQASEMGIQAGETSLDFQRIQLWKDQVVKKLTHGVASLLKGNGIEVVCGKGKLIHPNEILVTNQEQSVRYGFEHCILATGSRPIELKPFPFKGRIISSTEALSLKEVPKSMMVIGGGYIGIELGQTFAKFGTKVTVIEGEKQILPLFETEMVRWVQRKLKKDGVEIFTKAKALSAFQNESEVTLRVEVSGKEKILSADYLLVTVGRRPNTDGLGLQEIGIELDERGLVPVNSQGRTVIPHIFAIGDIVSGPALAHKASHEGKVAAEVIGGLNSHVNYKSIPSVVFSDPEIASVGLNEVEAKEKGYTVITGKFNYAANGRALALHAGEGFVKVVAEKESGMILGAQMVGPSASDLISEMALAVENEMRLENIAKTIHAHPTLGEMIAEAVDNALGHGVHSILK